MKKKITAAALVVALLAIAVIGGSLAYFTDSKAQTNTFTAGKVAITLDEAKVEKDAAGNLVAKYDNEQNAERTTENEGQTYKLYPGMTVTKDPTITLAADSEDAYIAAKITIKGEKLWDLYGVWTEGQGEKYWNIDINKFVSGGLIMTGSTQSYSWNGLSMIFTDTAGNVYYQDAKEDEWVIYVFLKDVKHADDKIVLFETITVDAEFENEDMAKLNNATVEVKAFAVQTNGFTTNATDATDCFKAMTTAFASEFSFTS